MAASKEGLIDNINCKLTTGGLTDMQASQLAGAAQALCCSSFYAVPCEACLPNAALNKGRFVYITSLDIYRYSNGTSWTSNFCSSIGNSLYSWGYNNFSQIASSGGARSSPAVIDGAISWNKISSGSTHSVTIKRDGTLWTWGSNGNGELGNGATASGCATPITTAGGGTTWCVPAAGCCYSAAIKTDGTLWTWGVNGNGILGDGTTTSRRSPGTVAGGGTNWCSITAGWAHTAAIKTDGTLWTWGWNGWGQLGTGDVTARSSPGTVAGGGTNWCAVSVGELFTMAVKTDGSLWTWGHGYGGALGDGSNSSRSSPGTVAGGGTNWCTVAAGCRFSAAIKTDGTLWTWGCNNFGQLGTGNTTNRCSPGTVAGGGTTWSKISVSINNCSSMAAIKTDGTLWTWGNNCRGQLGNETTVSRSSPGTIAGGITKWREVSVGLDYMTALTYDSGF